MSAILLKAFKIAKISQKLTLPAKNPILIVYMAITQTATDQIVVKRDELKHLSLDIGGRDIIIGFNEPVFRYAKNNPSGFDAKLNARLPAYFLPAVEVASKQEVKPRLILVSGLNVALKWNAANERERKIMTVNNRLKFDFLQAFFKHFFPIHFSSVESVIAHDLLKVDDNTLLQWWRELEQKFPQEIAAIKIDIARFKKPGLFNSAQLSPEAVQYLSSDDPNLINGFKYALSHLFALADVNLAGSFFHNPVGYLSIGGHQEKVFNAIRLCAFELIKQDHGHLLNQNIVLKDNLKLVVENGERIPPPYNGAYRKNGDRLFLEEVTYENEQELSYYDEHAKLKSDMEYMYALVGRSSYENFWNTFRGTYFDLKAKYCAEINIETTY